MKIIPEQGSHSTLSEREECLSVTARILRILEKLQFFSVPGKFLLPLIASVMIWVGKIEMFKISSAFTRK